MIKKLLFSGFLLLLAINLARLYFVAINPELNWKQLYLSQILEALSKFQDNWFVLAEDFADLLSIIKKSIEEFYLTFNPVILGNMLGNMLIKIFEIIFDILYILGYVFDFILVLFGLDPIFAAAGPPIGGGGGAR